MNWRKVINQIRFDLSGATTVEYGLILAVIFFAMLAAFRAFATSFQILWTTTSNVISTAIGA